MPNIYSSTCFAIQSLLFLLFSASAYSQDREGPPDDFQCPSGTSLIEEGDSRGKSLFADDRIYSCMKADGLVHGPVLRTSKEGVVLYRGRKKAGMLDGTIRLYHRNGKKSWEIQYVDGTPVGESTHWDVYGRVSRIDTFENGVVVKSINEHGKEIDPAAPSSVLPPPPEEQEKTRMFERPVEAQRYEDFALFIVGQIKNFNSETAEEQFQSLRPYFSETAYEGFRKRQMKAELELIRQNTIVSTFTAEWVEAKRHRNEGKIIVYIGGQVLREFNQRLLPASRREYFVRVRRSDQSEDNRFGLVVEGYTERFSQNE